MMGATIESVRGTKNTPDTNSVVLKVTDVTKTFDGVCALDGVGFSIRKGHIKALIGPNGAGKTTLLNIINGLLAPDEGSVSFQGHELIGMNTDKIAILGLSRTFQLIRLFTVNEATVLDNVLLGAHKHTLPSIPGVLFFRSRTKRIESAMREKAMEMLRFVGMDWAAQMTPGSLSFGNQRMVELARSLMAVQHALYISAWPILNFSFSTSQHQASTIRKWSISWNCCPLSEDGASAFFWSNII